MNKKKWTPSDKKKQYKKLHREEEKQEKEALRNYRHVQSALAIERDDNVCVFCYFQGRGRVPRAELHHVYGRGKEPGDFRENYQNLLSTCKACHPPPIHQPGASKSLSWVEDIRKLANEKPINSLFFK